MEDMEDLGDPISYSLEASIREYCMDISIWEPSSGDTDMYYEANEISKNSPEL